jgi:hypothetical protein
VKFGVGALEFGRGHVRLEYPAATTVSHKDLPPSAKAALTSHIASDSAPSVSLNGTYDLPEPDLWPRNDLPRAAIG